MKKKLLSVFTAMVMTTGMFAGFASTSSAEEEMTDVGTPRSETLIVEAGTSSDTPGQFNPYMNATVKDFGIHQLMTCTLWEMDTMSGEQFGEVADGMPEANEDYTEFTVKIREGIKWSDGVDLTASDVAYTFNMVLDNDFSMSAYWNTVFESVEAVDDYTVKIITKDSFPRLALKFGVTTWGSDLCIVPEHIYSQQEDVTTFLDSDPVVAGPYTMASYDPLGTWILYQLRDDYEDCTLGVMGYDKPEAEYVLFRVFQDDSTRQMAMINNEVDILCEVTPEMLEVMMDSNENISAWYDEYPYALSDDPGSKGLAFSMAKDPYSSADFRWGIALAMNIDEITMNIFDGVGRVSPFAMLTATTSMMEYYYLPMLEWVEELELDLGDGTTIKPFDPDYKYRMAETLRDQGYDIPDDEETLTDMFGIGWWKYDTEAATKLFIKAGLELRDDGWYYDDKPFTINLTYMADSETQAARGVQAAYDQLTKFGFNCTIASESSATWDTNHSTGNFDIAGYWPTNGITKDLYSLISSWDADLITPLGETTSGEGSRWYNEEATEIIHELENVDPDSDESYELCTEFMKIAITDMAFLNFQAGIKYVPTNSTYWTNYPTAENPYNGPWWWWSCFKYILVNFEQQ